MMRRLLPVLPVVLVLLAATVGPLALGRAIAGPSELVLAQRGDDSPCIVEHSKRLRSKLVTIGDTASITLTAKVTCPVERIPLHVVLVLDASFQSAVTASRQFATGIIQGLDLAEETNARVGVVAFGSTGHTLCNLTNDGQELARCLNKLDRIPGRSIDQGINEGLKVLMRGRGGRGATAAEDVHEVLILLAFGGNPAGCPTVLQASIKAKGQGILVMTVCGGPDCEEQCLRQAATSPRYFYLFEDAPEDILVVLRDIRDEVLEINLKKLAIKDELPENMRYVPGTAVPAPKSISPTGDILEWETNFVPPEGVTFTFEIEPLVLGVHPANVEASGTFRDNRNRDGTFTFGVAYMKVILPVDENGSACQVETEGTVHPQTVELGDTVGVTLTVQGNCPEGETVPLQIVLALDASATMAGQKNRDMKDAAKKLVQRLKLRDHPDTSVGVLVFSDRAETRAELSNIEGEVIAAINRTGSEGGKAIDAGIDESAAALARANADFTNDPELVPQSIIVMTDGLNDAGCEPVLETADLLKQAGVHMMSVCVGADCDSECMHQLASRPDYFVAVRDASQLLDVLEQLRPVDTSDLSFTALTVTDILPDDMAYVPGSGRSAPIIDPSGKRLTWQVGFPEPSPLLPLLGFTLQVEPLRPGWQSTSVEASAVIEDSIGRGGAFTFELPAVEVHGEERPPTVYLPVVSRL